MSAPEPENGRLVEGDIMHRRTFLTAASAAITMAAATPARVFAETTVEDLLSPVHPELKAAARALLAPDQAGRFGVTHSNYLKRRAAVGELAKSPAPDIPVEKRQIPGLSGQPPVTIYIINAGANVSRPAILHTHGGGYVTGSAWGAIAGLQDYCRRLDCVVVSVEYRLAPETTYRGSVEDNYAALKWLYNNAASIGADPARIAVMGESAGGGHAAILAITARNRGEVPIAFQCLTYPMLDDRTGTSHLVPSHIGRLVWSADNNRFGWHSFLGMTPGMRNVPDTAVPARVVNLKGLPPTFIGVGGIDLFVDEDVDYAQRLNAASVQTELIVVPGVFHAFDIVAPNTRLVQEFQSVKLAALRRGLSIG